MSSETSTAIWTAQRTALSVLLALPTIVPSALFAGVLLLSFSTVTLAFFAALAIALVTMRVIAWTMFAAPRTVVVTDSHLRVVRADKTLVEMPWAETAAVELKRGDGLPSIILDVTSGSADFPYIRATPTDVWDTRGSFPGLLAILPSEFRRLATALELACAERSIPFTVEGR